MVKNIKRPDPATIKIAALERAVRDLMKNFNDTNIHGMVNCIMRGWIRNGEFTAEYLELTRQAEAAALAETEQRRREYEASLSVPDSTIITLDTNQLLK